MMARRHDPLLASQEHRDISSTSVRLIKAASPGVLLAMAVLIAGMSLPLAATVLRPDDFWGLVAGLAAIVAMGLGAAATAWAVAELRWRLAVAASRKRPGPMGHAGFVAYLEAKDARERGATS